MPAPTFYFDVIHSDGSDSLSGLSEFNDAQAPDKSKAIVSGKDTPGDGLGGVFVLDKSASSGAFAANDSGFWLKRSERSLTFPEDEPTNFDTELPTSANRKNKVVYFNPVSGEQELIGMEALASRLIEARPNLEEGLQSVQTASHQTLLDAPVVSWDLDDGAFATLVIDADRELELPLNLKVGHFVLRVVQGQTGGHRLTIPWAKVENGWVEYDRRPGGITYIRFSYFESGVLTAQWWTNGIFEKPTIFTNFDSQFKIEANTKNILNGGGNPNPNSAFSDRIDFATRQHVLLFDPRLGQEVQIPYSYHTNPPIEIGFEFNLQAPAGTFLQNLNPLYQNYYGIVYVIGSVYTNAEPFNVPPGEFAVFVVVGSGDFRDLLRITQPGNTVDMIATGAFVPTIDPSTQIRILP